VSAALFDIGIIRDRLRAVISATELRTIQGASDFAAVQALQDFPAPCAYVVLAQERGGESSTGYAPRGAVARTEQMLTVTFGVVLVARNYRDQRGEELAAALSRLVDLTRSALLGYVPDLPGARGCQFAEGELKDYDASTAVWVDVYTTQHSIGSTP
jgi:hypothetical protein